MKKHLFYPIFFAAMLFSLSAAFGQKFVKKGTILGNGTVDLFSGKQKVESASTFEYNITSISISPWVGYFIADDIGVGAQLNVSTFGLKDDAGDKDTETEITFGPVVRYYFAEGPFAQGYFGIGSEKNKSESGAITVESKESISEWEVGVGYSARISDTVFLDPMLGYGSTTHNNKDFDAKNIFSGIFIRVGFTILLVAP